MQTPSSPSDLKPITDWWRPDLVSLPKLTLARRVFRFFIRRFAKLLIFILTKAKINGMKNFPRHGPAIVVINHLGDADAVLLGSTIPVDIEAMGKIELNEHWLAGPVLRAYGIIWVHRGKADRKAVRAALDGLSQGRILALAPEGRQSVAGGLEEGTEGAAFLAMKSGAPIVPVGMTGTENENVYGHMHKWKRASVTLTVGKPFHLEQFENRQHRLREGTEQIMEALAAVLPVSYRGKYREEKQT